MVDKIKYVREELRLIFWSALMCVLIFVSILWAFLSFFFTDSRREMQVRLKLGTLWFIDSILIHKATGMPYLFSKFEKAVIKTNVSSFIPFQEGDIETIYNQRSNSHY